MKTIYCLVSTDLSKLGGPMGSDDSTPTRFRKYYTSLDKAADTAEKDYGNQISWKKSKIGFDSGDLLHTRYFISPIKLEA